MESRFGFKDFVFAVLFLVVIGAVVWGIYQSSYQEERLNGLKQQLTQMADAGKQQLGVLAEIRNELKAGVRVNGGGVAGTQGSGGTTDGDGIVRKTEADGSVYVYGAKVPDSPRHPDTLPDFAYGDWIVENLGGEPSTIVPYIEKDVQGQLTQSSVLESLVGTDPQTLLEFPFLADWYRISPDGLQYTFHLRPGVCFSDGVAMTADDVVFSYNTLMNADVDAAPQRSFLARIKTCQKIDDKTVQFEMKEPYFHALSLAGGMSIIPEHIYKFKTGDDYNKRGDLLVGSGPYKLDKWDKGQKITMVRNEKYWGDRPTFDRIVYLFIGNSQAQMQSFMNGELDYLGEPIEPDAEEYLKYSADPEFLKKFKAYRFVRPNAMSIYIGYNEEKPMFKDKETRQALTMLIDRKSIIEKMMKGMGMEMTGPFNPMTPQNDKTIEALPYDPEGAKKKLAEAGWVAGADGVLVRDGVRFEFDMSFRTGVPIRERIATYMQQQLQQAGIRMRLTPYEASVLIEHFDSHSYDASLAGWGAAGTGEEDPYQIWDSASIANKGSNYISYSNPEADKLIEEGRRTMDEGKRMEIWHKLQKVLYEDQPYTWLFAEMDCAFVNGRFKNTEPYPLGLLDMDWYVPAAEQKYK